MTLLARLATAFATCSTAARRAFTSVFPFATVPQSDLRERLLMKIGASVQAIRLKFATLKGSVIRRGVGLLALTLPAALFNLGLSYLASRWLGAEDFGIYYAAITAINIAFAPATILNLFFTRAVATVGAEFDAQHAARASSQVFRLIVSWGAVLTALAVVGAAAIWGIAGSFALPVAIFVAVVVYLSYCSEVGRIALQGAGRFLPLGVYTIAWMSLRFAGGAIGIYFFQSVWAGLAGIAIATLIPMSVLFRPWTMFRERYFRPWSEHDDAGRRLVSLIKLRDFAKLSVGFLLFMLIAHADILAAYVLLEATQLSVYSASSVLPKGMLVATLPLIQLVFPLIVGEKASARPTITLVVRGAVLTLAVAGAGALVITALSEPLCSGPHGIASCDSMVMRYGLISIIAMCLLRLAISVDYAARNDWVPFLLMAPIVIAGPALSASATSSPLALGQSYALFSAATLAAYSAVSIALRVYRIFVARVQASERNAA